MTDATRTTEPTGIDQPAAEIQPVTSEAGGALESSFGVEQRGLFGVHGSGDTSGFGGLVREPLAPTAAQRPYGGYFDEVVDALIAAYPPAAAAIRTVVGRPRRTDPLPRARTPRRDRADAAR